MFYPYKICNYNTYECATINLEDGTNCHIFTSLFKITYLYDDLFQSNIFF